MRRRQFIMTTGAALATAGFGLAGCTTTSPSSSASPSANASKRDTINAGVDSTLSRLYANVAGSRELVDKARGVLVFPSVISAGFWIGGQYGEGALRVAGRTAGYYSTVAGSFGLQIGAQSKALVFLFMTQDALDKFLQQPGMGSRRRCNGRRAEGRRERRGRYLDRHQPGRSFCADERRADGRRVARRHQGLTSDDLSERAQRTVPLSPVQSRSRSHAVCNRLRDASIWRRHARHGHDSTGLTRHIDHTAVKLTRFAILPGHCAALATTFILSGPSCPVTLFTPLPAA